MKLRKKICLILAVILTLSVIVPGAFAAEQAVASTLRLDATEGTITVRNRAGKNVAISERMKLYSGYSLASALASYGYISLDDTKAIKLDALSEVQVKQSGQKLEVNLVSGNLLFDITAPLREGESLNIRTSTMVTGIRGTAGFVKVINEKVSEIYLLTGSVGLTSTDPITGEAAEVTLRPGQQATSYVRDVDWGEEIVEIVIDQYVEADVPGYVAVAIRDSLELQEKITEETELSVPLIVGLADERLAEDEAALLALQDLADEQQRELDNAKAVDPLFRDAPTSGGSGGPPARISVSLPSPTTQQVEDALRDAHDITVTGNWTMNVNDRIVIDDTRTLNIAGTLNMGVNGIIYNMTTRTLNLISGTITGTGMICNGLDPSGTHEVGVGAGKMVVGAGTTIDSGIGIIQNHPSSVAEVYGTVLSIIEMQAGSTTIRDGGAVDGIACHDGTLVIEADLDSNGDGGGRAVLGLVLYGGTTTLGGTASAVDVDAPPAAPVLTITGQITEVLNIMSGTVNMTGGTITTALPTGEAVIVEPNGTFIMTGGTVRRDAFTGTTTLYNRGTLTLDGGTVAGHVDNQGTLDGDLSGNGFSFTYIDPTEPDVTGTMYGSLAELFAYMPCDRPTLDYIVIDIPATAAEIPDDLTVGGQQYIILNFDAAPTTFTGSITVEAGGALELKGNYPVTLRENTLTVQKQSGLRILVNVTGANAIVTMVEENAIGVDNTATFTLDAGSTLYTPNTLEGEDYGISVVGGAINFAGATIVAYN